MMTDADLQSVIRTCGGPVDRSNVTARFRYEKEISVTCLGNASQGFLRWYIADYLRDAPIHVIRDLVKKYIQKEFYDSPMPLGQDTKKWLINGISTEANVRTYLQRNSLTFVEQYNDAIVVTSSGEIVDTSVFFKVIKVPRSLIGSPDYNETVQDAYEDMEDNRAFFLTTGV